ncbi:C-C motif chemokine 4 homolog [Engraulis encrasicolus]|uniref:C-C motif chemokine 4 homolog n=1 Tax=Engraulis encrasicolus TaxID=184585 RepID=UPI002FCF827C
MKLCCAVAVAVLVLALCSQGESSTAGPDNCCFEFYTKPIPASRIKGYQETIASCPTKGMIFTTVTDKKICANPEDKKVQAIIEKVDNLFGTPDPAPAR